MIDPSMTRIPAETQALMLAARVLELITEANGGRWPDGEDQWPRISRRFGVRLKFVPAPTLSEPLLRNGRVYLPTGIGAARLRCFLLHELAEAILKWPGEAPCVAQVTPHEVAEVVETLIGYKRRAAITREG